MRYPSSTTGSYAWIIPDAIGTTLRVKVSNVSDTAVYAVSNANFTIKGSLTLISPVGGEVWIVASSYPITWSVSGSIANAKLVIFYRRRCNLSECHCNLDVRVI